MNDSRIFEHPQDCSSSDSERRFREQKVVCTFCSTLLDTWAKGRLSHIIITMAEADKNFFNKIIMEDETWCIVCDPKTKRWIVNGLVRHPLSQRNSNSKSHASRSCW
jgi:hypothetical protein